MVLVGNGQLGGTGGVTVREGATLEARFSYETINNLTLSGGTVLLDSFTTLNITGGVTTTDAANDTASSIRGGGVLSLGANVTFDIADDAAVADDLSITAAVAGGGFAKNGYGTLSLSGNNTYTGTTTVNAGSLVAANANALGSTAGGTTLNGGTTLTVSGGITLAAEGLTIDRAKLAGAGGNNVVTGAISVFSNGDSTFAAAGGTTLTLSGVVSSNGFNFLNVGTGTEDGTVVLAGANTFTDDIYLNNGTLVATSDTAFGDANNTITRVGSEASIALDGGVTVNQSIIESGTAGTGVGATGTFRSLSGVNTLAGNIFVYLTGTLVVGVDTGSSLAVNGFIQTFASPPFTKVGGGTLTLSNTGYIYGPTTVAAGTLLVDGSIAASSGVTVASGAVLGGTGAVSAVTVNTGGTLSPGNSPGILSTGDLALNVGSVYLVELDGTTAGTQYDQTAVTGTVDLAGATLSIHVGYTPASGDVYTIISNDGSDAVAGTFDGLAEGVIFTSHSRQYKVSYVGGTGNDVTLTDMTVPTVLSVTPSRAVVTDSAAGTGGLALTVVFDQAMDTAVAPTLTLPAGVAGTLTLSAASAWQNATTYKAVYDVTDAGVTVSAAGVTVAGATSAFGVSQGSATATGVFSVDTANPAPVVTAPTGAIDSKPILFSVNFGEVVTGFTDADLIVTNGTLLPGGVQDLGGGVYQFRVRPTGDGLVTVSVAAAAAVDASGNSSAIGSGSATFDLDRYFVRELYREVLGREGDTAGIGYWTSVIDGGKARTFVAKNFWESVEHRTAEVKAMYQTYLHRAADAGGLANAVNLLRQGVSENTLRASILGSAEYRAAHATPAAYVTAVYGDVLGRAADANGRAFWEGRLSAGAVPRAMAASLLSSTESYKHLADRYYADLADRPATPQERTSAAATLAGTNGEEILAVFLAGSDDFLVH